MPVLDYGPLSEPGGLLRAQYAVRAVMAWPDPNDEQHRREYLATLLSMHIAKLGEMRDTLPDPSAAVGWEETITAIRGHERWGAAQNDFEAWFEEFGGHATVSMAPGLRYYKKNMEKSVSRWFAAGLILALVRRLAAHHSDLRGGASVKKAIFILEQVNGFNVPRNSHDLYRAWKTYKRVAHFCAALFDSFYSAYRNNYTPDEIATAMEQGLGENFMDFLSEAEAYLKFGLSHQPSHSKAHTLLSPEETWILPQYRPWPKSPFKPAPLSGSMLQAAREYRAPFPGA